MVIIKCHQFMPAAEFAKSWENLVRMVEIGVVLLPPGYELLDEVPPDTEVVAVKPGEMMTVEEFIAYIDNAFRDRPHGDSFWIDERERHHTADVGYAFEWWRDIMEPELRRVFGDRRADE